MLPERVLVAPPLVIGAIKALSNGDRQIALEVLVCPTGGENKIVKVLIDSGAQKNAVKRGLLPEHVMRPAKRPQLLGLADGQTRWGGDREVSTRLTLGRVVNHVVHPLRVRADFYEADIRIDMILSLPWLAENGLDVLTREKCLGQRKGWRMYPITSCPDFQQKGNEEESFIETSPSKMIGCNAPRASTKGLGTYLALLWPRPKGGGLH